MFDTKQLVSELDQLHDDLVTSVHQVLVDLVYEHRSFLRPSQLRQVAIIQSDNLFAYLNQKETKLITNCAEKFAQMGVSLKSLLQMHETMRGFVINRLSSVHKQHYVNYIAEYTSIFVQEFFAVREALILEEQERIRAAMQRSLSNNNLWLQTAAEVSRVATSTLNLTRLLSDSVDIIRRYFEFHHVGLFLIEQENMATLKAESGSDSANRLGKKHRIGIQPDNIVGNSILDRQAKILVDVGTRDFQLDVSILPETHSAMILPMMSREKIIGAILIQSIQAATFGDDDIIRLQTVADQMANAIQNARLYYELELYSQDLENAVKARTSELENTKDRVEAILNNSPDAILLLSPDGKIEMCNQAVETMFGYHPDDLLKKSLHTLVVPEYATILDNFVNICSSEGQAKWFQTLARRSDEDEFDAGAALAAINNDGIVTGLVCSIRDISEQVQAEEKIKSSLEEKEVLLREIHHRVKNNMQVISSLLALQAGYVDDPNTHLMFRESQNRIRSMALVHELLYQSNDLAKIDFVAYVRKLSQHLLGSYLTDRKKVSLDIVADEIFLEIDKAIPCGLIINELISNAFKHAFPNDKSGTLLIELRTDGQGMHTVLVRDNGVGIPDSVNVHQTETLGLRLVTSLADQLNATIGLHRHNGTTFEIRFAL